MQATIKTNLTKKHKKQLAFLADKCRNKWIFGGNRTGKTTAGAIEAVNRALRAPCEGWVVSLSTQVQRDVAQRKVLEILDEREIAYDCVMLSGRADNPHRGVIDFIEIGGAGGEGGNSSVENCPSEPSESKSKNKKSNSNNENSNLAVTRSVTRVSQTLEFPPSPPATPKSRIGFKNCEQGREKFQGTGLDWVWFDEEPPLDVYEECLIRTMDKRGAVFGTMTPLKGRTWVYERIFMNAGGRGSGVSVHEWSWADNPYLDKKEIAQMERNYSAEVLESRKFGHFLEGLGMVFKEFSNENIIRDALGAVQNGMALSKNEKPCYNMRRFVYTGISIDPGYTNPTAVLWFGVDNDGNIFVIDEYKESGRTVEQIAKTIFDKSKDLNIAVKNVFIDSAATAQTLGEPKSVAEQFKGQGIDVNTSVEKNVLDGIFRVKSLFCSADGTRKLFVYANCVNLVQEIRGYFWGDHNRPVKSNDHCLDALRYFVMSRHENYNGQVGADAKPVEKSGNAKKFEKHKRRILNENR